VIGSIGFLNMGLKAFVFTKADEEMRVNYAQPIVYPIEKIEKLQSNETLSTDEKQQIEQMLKDYKDWKDRTEKVDYVTSQRHEDASLNLALILIGLPLYFFHWRIIKRETNK
jgi:hypothetical protein